MTTPASRNAPPRSNSIRRNAAFAFLSQITGAAFTAALTVFLARSLGTRGYGVLSLALGIAGLVMLPSDFGISNSVARYVAEHRAERRRVEAVLADGLRLKLMAAVWVSVLLALVSGPLALAYGIPALVWPIRGLALAIFGQSLMMLGVVFIATGRAELWVWTALTESALELTATVALVLAGAGAAGAAFGQGVAYLVGAATMVVLLVRLLGPGILPRGARFGPEAQRIAGYAGVLLIVDGAYTAFSQIDILIIGGYLGARSAGIFSAPMRLTTFFSYPGQAVASGVAPRMARGGAGNEPSTDAFLAGLRLLLIAQAAITAFSFGWADLLVKVALGTGFKESASVLRALSPYIFLSGFGALVSLSANYLGEAKRRVPVALATVAVNVGLDLVLVPRMGPVGGAVGTDLAYAVYAPAHLFICQRALGLDLRPTLRTLLRTSLAGVVMAAILLLFGAPLDRPWMIVGGGLLGLGMFTFILWITGEATPAELRVSVSTLRSRRTD